MKVFKDFQVLFTALCGLTLVLGLSRLHPSLPYWSVLFGSYFAIQAAYASLRERSFDVNFLMVLAAAGAIAIGHVIDAAGLLFLFSLSSTLESLAMARTKSAIEGLIKLRPAEALLITAEGDLHVPVESVEVGSQVRVLPFEQIPSDGLVVSGESSVDQSAMTGESVPVPKAPGDSVLAGTQNLDSMLVVGVTARSGDTTLEKIVGLVRDAQENKASGERISNWFGHRYTFFVVFAFGVSLLARVLMGTANPLYEALVLLVALSPCAVVISTPATTLSALAWAGRNGILIRGGRFIEEMGRIDIVAMDKTGTLTFGKPVLEEICLCTHRPAVAGGASTVVCHEQEGCWRRGREMPAPALQALELAAAAEQYSTHPIAQAIVAAARERNLDVPEAEQHRAFPGLGIEASVGDQIVKVGQRKFFEEVTGELPAGFQLHIEEIQREGMTVVVMATPDTMAAFGMRDAPRLEARAALEELQALGVTRTAMVTGDTAETAKAVASELGIEEFHAGLMPADKEKILEDMTREGRTVMVGDGINDAPSLARANVGIAMGGLGSDVALNAADIVLMQDRIEKIPQIIRLGRRTNTIIGANLTFATLVIVGLAVGSFIFPLPLWLAVLGHEGSTVLVILNGLRLLKGP